MPIFDAFVRTRSGKIDSSIFLSPSYDKAMMKKIPGKKLIGVKLLEAVDEKFKDLAERHKS